MKTEHTPGPWGIENWSYDDGTRHKTVIVAKNEDAVAHVWGVYRTNGGEEERQANARLIAAAPDLLIAAKGVIAALTRPKTFMADMGAALILLEKAIAKAEGVSHD